MKKKQKQKPIGEEMLAARDRLWNPRLAPPRTPISDIAMPLPPLDRVWWEKPTGKPLTAIIGLVRELMAALGDRHATRMYLKKLLAEAKFETPRTVKERLDEIE